MICAVYFQATMTTPPFPALFLSLIHPDVVSTPRRVPLVPGGEPMIAGRSMPDVSKTARDDNLYFDSGTFSRQHAEVFLTAANEVGPSLRLAEHMGMDEAELLQFMIRDIGSVNGTYVNGRRLSAPQEASQPQRLQTGDIVVRRRSGNRCRVS
jgi:pSer/pThr/pTyr-binding forkhead associated (FHA) protein